MSRDAYRQLVREACATQLPAPQFDEETWQRFSARLDYVELDATEAAAYGALSGALAGRDATVRCFYLATAPELFGPIASNLAAAGLVTPVTRLVLEKPLGKDLASAQAINAAIGASFSEQQIFRIDHYLGKETVQNLMVLRFANGLFEPLWNRTFVDHVQITVAETVGVGGRWSYYDQAGALRDMVQNHMLQLLCLTAMEPPITLDDDAVRDEKLKVLKSLHPDSRRGCRAPDRPRPVPCRRDRRPAGARLSRGDRCGSGERHRDLRRGQGGHRELALGGRAVLPAHRQASPLACLRDRGAVQDAAARAVSRERRRDPPEPPGDAAAARRRHPPADDEQAARAG